MTPTQKAQLILEYLTLNEETKGLATRQKEIRDDLVAAGVGEVSEILEGADGSKLQVIVPADSMGSPTDEKAARELAGTAWSTLFDRAVIHKPVKSFSDLAEALLGKAKAKKLRELCRKPGATQWRFGWAK